MLDLGAESMGHHQFSEELRLSGNFDHFLDWTAGAYYFRERRSTSGTRTCAYAFIFTGFPNLLNFYQNDPIEAHDKAGFVHTTFHLTPKLDAILGLRYTTQDKTYNYVRLAAGRHHHRRRFCRRGVPAERCIFAIPREPVGLPREPQLTSG